MGCTEHCKSRVRTYSHVGCDDYHPKRLSFKYFMQLHMAILHSNTSCSNSVCVCVRVCFVIIYLIVWNVRCESRDFTV